MRPHGVVLLAVVTLLTINNVDARSDFHAATSVTTAEHSVSTNRFLRNSYLSQVDDDERAINTGLKSFPGADMVSSFITKQKLAVWLKNNKDTDDVFVGLKLNAADDSILKNPKFVAWVKYVDNYNAKNPGQPSSILAPLKKHVNLGKQQNKPKVPKTWQRNCRPSRWRPGSARNSAPTASSTCTNSTAKRRTCSLALAYVFGSAMQKNSTPAPKRHCSRNSTPAIQISHCPSSYFYLRKPRARRSWPRAFKGNNSKPG
ncbi:secreted RxLR effector peptide protein, putative [Phytophthora infestans T30-4]|uniref:RxLR effector protein n=1 Tax=Phytophthora infestans (strain T30-4) TaxID=403677 RepID=D0P1V6_PHYIT|nr:secreted RxLR effector peptide protein, putative [Phytophthora infestans T30-4]EEY55089.1 secreted RxLR effector peptide protein, putative [Phytophthora infestans T30-4]|eukprot:XP_002895719.1 secreted RxLR effector peptide protein, putative [Phytophthora infestans T30-4]